MVTQKDESQLAAARQALEELEPKNQLTDRLLIKSMFVQISSLKSKGVKYRAIYDALVKSAGMRIGYATFVVYVREAQKQEAGNKEEQFATDEDLFPPIPSDKTISASKSGRF